MNTSRFRFTVGRKVALLLFLVFGIGIANKLYLLIAVHTLEQRVEHMVAAYGVVTPAPATLILDQSEVLSITEHLFSALAFAIVPMWIVLICFLGWLLVRSILAPLRQLRIGTVELGAGNVEYRIALHGNDEFADVARAFNSMSERLQATMVSRQLLENNQQQLQSTIIALSGEMRQREHSERARLELLEKLQRSETLSVLGAVVGGVAHEVRNPLFGISSTLDAMRARFGTAPEQKRYIEILDNQVKRLTALMEDLLEYGKPPALELRTLPINRAIELAVTACKPSADKTYVSIENHVSTTDGAVEMDLHRLTQVFRNLLDNAIHHAPTDSTVTLSASRVNDGDTPSSIRCSVRDHGPGFNVDDLPKVFSPFFTRRRGGTGLGLSIAQRIVEQHGGTIEAIRCDDGGAEVRVTLPLIESPELMTAGAQS